jgi:hypothetical protein
MQTFSNKATARQGVTLGFAYLMPNSWLEVILHPEGPATRTRSRVSVVFFGPRANAELVPKFHVALLASHADLPIVTSKFRPNIALPMSDQIAL